jgi:XTP/dITP diphosphohydrolase
MKLLIATTNSAKLAELGEILSDQGFEVVGLDRALAEGFEETGLDFAENALLKARHYHRLTGLPTVADDSGLEVEALGGAPGIYSARYAGPGATDADRVAKLLNELEGVPAEDRAARFVCAAAVVLGNQEKVFTAEVCGRILTQPRGKGGFGYDPVFYYEPLGKTFAELTRREKSAVSHRGLAFRKLADWLKQSGIA